MMAIKNPFCFVKCIITGKMRKMMVTPGYFSVPPCVPKQHRSQPNASPQPGIGAFRRSPLTLCDHGQTV